MNVHALQVTGPGARRASAAIDNLRGIVVLMVIAVHSVLAYAAYAPSRPAPFVSAPWLWQTFPVVDSHRFIGFDIFCAWANIFLMPLFFLVSGFFVWKSIERNGAPRFALRRAARLGPPFILGVALIMPIAIYPAYAERTAHPAFSDYLRQLRDLPFWPDGPLWFLFVLLIFDWLAACLFVASPSARNSVRLLAILARRTPAQFLAVFFHFPRWPIYRLAQCLVRCAGFSGAQSHSS
jgi:peptidoglycan/LPS O-acetylase OafA/YrhL